MMLWVPICAYLIGSIPFALIVARGLAGVDLRVAGSGNLGATNVLRTTRPSLALLAVCLDLAKGIAAVAVANLAAQNWAPAVAAFAAVAGHVYPMWLRFRGGKGVAVACGTFSVLAPLATAIAVAIFLTVVWVTRYVSLGSITAAFLLAPLMSATGEPRAVVGAAWCTTALIVFRHRANMWRLMARTERRLGEHA